jgi:lipopolysaccharide transport system ATP-binding protein
VSKPAIVVENLSKAYRIGQRAASGGRDYRTFRDAMIDAAKAPFRRLRQLGRDDTTGDDTFWALKDVSFEVQPGEVVGIIGRNGAGKSTLLKILSRITEPTGGRATLRGRVASLLEVGTGFHAELTGRENIYLNGAILGMKKAEIASKFDEIVAFSEIDTFLDTPVKKYSSGMYVRLAFAVAAYLEPEILVVDEVLAVGDTEFQKKCLGKMQEVAHGHGRTVLFVSHNMGAVRRLCSRAVVLTKGAVLIDAATETAVEQYNAGLAQEAGPVSSEGPHVLYSNPNDDAGDFAVTKVEVLDSAGRPLPMISTWDRVIFRISYRARRNLAGASVVIEIMSADGEPLLLLSTQPDGTLPLAFHIGAQSVECEIDSIPFAAGVYTVGIGLAVPRVEYLWQRRDLAKFTVHERDVYGSGLSPTSRRCRLAVKHEWRASGVD